MLQIIYYSGSRKQWRGVVGSNFWGWSSPALLLRAGSASAGCIGPVRFQVSPSMETP